MLVADPPEIAETTSGHSPEATIILEALTLWPVSGRQERILRTIASKYYRRGYCFARHETIAAAIKCAKSTLQLDLDELEARGLISVTRRHGTSNVTLLAPGLIEALRIQRIERRRAGLQARSGVKTILGFVQSYQAQAARALNDLAAAAKDKLTEVSEMFTDAPSSVEKRTENSVNDSFHLENRPKAAKQPTSSTNVTSSNISTNTSSAKKSDDAQTKKIENETAALLEAEGVTLLRAKKLVSMWGVERVLRNIELGAHRTATNPGGYLAAAIGQDFASKHVRPDSEAAAVRAKESRTTSAQTTTAGVPKILEPVAPSHPMTIAAESFGNLPEEEQYRYLELARDAVTSAPPTWLAAALAKVGIEHPAVRGLIRTKAIELWKRST